ncbi:hypothetical protein QBC37DRAFT_401000 [Rhypophila decipiens]|uniref:Uncharacterized protein n=1 Tax=Rhypophila decipiens TaxID=261697 RepID=A0AAN7B7A8_9PEZI|nr:hypothetical protein QBC37DRAFT_401000 [Rhypophila decipiens]
MTRYILPGKADTDITCQENRLPSLFKEVGLPGGGQMVIYSKTFQVVGVALYNCAEFQIQGQKRGKTYNTGNSPVVTHLSTSPTVIGLSMGEQTGSRVFQRVWSYVLASCQRTVYNARWALGVLSADNLPTGYRTSDGAGQPGSGDRVPRKEQKPGPVGSQDTSGAKIRRLTEFPSPVLPPASGVEQPCFLGREWVTGRYGVHLVRGTKAAGGNYGQQNLDCRVMGEHGQVPILPNSVVKDVGIPHWPAKAALGNKQE